MKKIIDLKIIDPRIGKDFDLPEYQTDGSAGVDLQACIDQTVSIRPGETELIDEGRLCPSGFVEAAVDGDGRSGVGDNALGQALRASANGQEQYQAEAKT